MIIERVIATCADKDATKAIEGVCLKAADMLNKTLYHAYIAESHSITWLPDRQLYLAVEIITIRK